MLAAFNNNDDVVYRYTHWCAAAHTSREHIVFGVRRRLVRRGWDSELTGNAQSFGTFKCCTILIVDAFQVPQYSIIKVDGSTQAAHRIENENTA